MVKLNGEQLNDKSAFFRSFYPAILASLLIKPENGLERVGCQQGKGPIHPAMNRAFDIAKP